MSILKKIGNMKVRYNTWKEEKEQKQYSELQTNAKLADMYNKREIEKKKLQKKVDLMKKDKYEKSVFGKIGNFVGELNQSATPTKRKCKKKGSKKLNLRKPKNNFGDDLFGGEDMFSR